MVDTNVLVYSTVAGCPRHRESRHWLAALQRRGVQLCISPQIVREYLVVLTRGNVFERQFTVDAALQELEAILPALKLLPETEEVSQQLRGLVHRYQVQGKRIHDANIVATMMVHQLKRLATYNRADFRDFTEVTLEPVATQG